MPTQDEISVNTFPDPNTQPSLIWNVAFSLLSDTIVVKQLALVIGIPQILVFIFLLIIQRPIDLSTFWWLLKIMLAITAFIVLLYAFVVVVLFRGRQEIRYTLDAKGIKKESAGIVKYMDIVKWLLILSGKPSAMGAGLLAQSPSAETVEWKSVDVIVPNSEQKTITLQKSRQSLMVIQCTEQNYGEVLQRAQDAVMLMHGKSK